ncbi:hypothetical protein [Streptomyces sp. bgisy153]|uniref:hypothetical protein n=1 Tax=Streptomyces sp. bgisy153 TaxID=3413793 RepID=UPI003D7479AD
MSTPPQPPQPPVPPSGSQPGQPPASQPGVPAGNPPAPSAYPYPDPQSPAGYPPPAGAPAQNFYGQPTMIGQPGQPGQPPVANPYAQPGAYPEVLGSPAGGGRGGAGRAVLWAAVGAVVASAAWAGGVFLLGGGIKGGDADLRGYQAPENLCTAGDYASFKKEYPKDDDTPQAHSVKDPAVDTSRCSLSLETEGTDSQDGYLSVDVALHKETDPGPEFTASWKNYDKMYSDYDVTEVEGIGDEAYLVADGSGTSSRYSVLAVRDGWVTYTMSFSAFSSYSADDDSEPPTADEIAEWLKTDTRATLDKLRK